MSRAYNSSRCPHDSIRRNYARDMHRIWLALVSAASLLAVDASAMPEAEVRKTREWAMNVEECFLGSLDAKRGPDSSLPVERTGFTKLFVFEQITKAASLQAKEGLVAVIRIPVKDFCRQLVDTYEAAYSAGVENARKTVQAGALAGLGTGHIESGSTFVQLTHNSLSSHNTGHYDLTLAAIEGSAWKGMRDLPKRLAAHASQMPDLFRWKLDVYHAHSPDYVQGDPGARARAVDEGTVRFQAELQSLVSKSIQYMAAEDWKWGVFYLGAASHMVQDLVYHRGMTLRQHSGLSYFALRNPDYPSGSLDEARRAEAVALTKRLFAKVRASFEPAQWDRFLAWTPDRLNYRDLATGSWGAEQIGVLPLMDYYLLSMSYLFGERDPAELEERGCGTVSIQGLICWIPETVVSGLLVK